uniref:Uncharacterized protein n=1 Tax=Caudovirales sp. ctCpR1 TaxID=2825760 RepID=A0A8S5V8U0_9CAUD|nr:MAG TPA: hypothetical protein [Caudovirales sp. ctCpR1]
MAPGKGRNHPAARRARSREPPTTAVVIFRTFSLAPRTPGVYNQDTTHKEVSQNAHF